MEKNRILFVIVLICLSSVFLSAYTSLDINLRFFEGIKERIKEQSRFVSNPYLQPIFTACIKTEFEPDEVERKIKKIFNLKDVNLIAETEGKWRYHGSDKIFFTFHLDGREYLILITPLDQARRHKFRVEALEKSAQNTEILLDTKIILLRKNTAVIGLEDFHGKPYFISFHISGGTVGGVVGGVIRCVKKDLN